MAAKQNQAVALRRVARAADRRAESDASFRAAVIHAAGSASIRQIATACGYSATHVHRILHGEAG